MRCSECRLICHEKCQDLINADCLQRAAERSSKKESLGEQTQRIISVMNKSMESRVESSPAVFDILRQVFGIDDKDHVRALNAARQSILDGTSQWRAKERILILYAVNLVDY
jgi:protein unc-13